MTTIQFAPAYAEIFLLIAASAILLIDLFVSDESRGVTYVLTLAALAGCAVITVGTARPETAYAFHRMFVDDVMGDVLKTLVYIAVAVTLVYSRTYVVSRGMWKGEFFTLTLFAVLGMMVMISASSLLTLYLGLELLSLALYALVALQRDSAAATEAAMKYFVLGALASGMLLYGMSMIYGATETLDLAEVSRRVAGMVAGDQPLAIVLVLGLVFIVAGLGFKLGAVPFHMWVPDVYHGAPTSVTLMIGSAPKLAAFAFVMRILVSGLEDLAQHWQQMLVILSVLSMAVGNLTAIAQTNLKRMLAYSTISHMGFLLLGVLSGTNGGYSAAMFYVLVYVMMNLGAFGMIMLLSRAGFEADRIEDFKGLNQRSPWYAFVTLLIMLSLAGVPPMVGFYAKFAVLQAVVDAGFIGLAVAAVLFSLIGAFYYLRIVKVMYFEPPQDQAPIASRADMRVLMSMNGLALLAFGILPQPLMALCIYSIQASF
jgi:NADH-quinone oxidoreductase subunit N